MFIGDFKNNKMDGHGVYYWKSGKVYDGEWKENRMDGEGVCELNYTSASIGQMVVNTKEAIKMISKKDMEFLNGLMDVTIKENGSRANNMGKAC